MSDVIERVKLWTPFDHNKLTLATYDADTGKMCQKVESENYITDVFQGIYQWYARTFMNVRLGVTTPSNDTGNNSNVDFWAPFAGGTGPTYASGVQAGDPAPKSGTSGSGYFAPSSCVLTSASHAVDTVNDRFIRGQLAGWAYCEPYAGADTRRGSCNATESNMSPTKSVFVFDWPTSAANGNIQSVYFANVNFTASAYYAIGQLCLQNSGGTGWSSASTPTWTGAEPANMYGSAWDLGFWLDPDGAHYWTGAWLSSPTAGTYAIQRSLYTGAITNSFILTGSGTNTIGFTNDGTSSLGNFWTYDNNGNLRKYSSTGAAISTTTYATLGIPQPNTYTGYSIPMFVQAGYIWLLSGTTGSHIYQILASGPTLASTLTLAANPTATSYQGAGTNTGMYYTDATNGDEIWLSNGNYQCNRYDLSGNWRGTFNILAAGGVFMSGGGMQAWPGGGFAVNYARYSSPNNLHTVAIFNNTRDFHTRSLLPSLVTKSNTQTMKLTYEFDYT